MVQSNVNLPLPSAIFLAKCKLCVGCLMYHPKHVGITVILCYSDTDRCSKLW